MKRRTAANDLKLYVFTALLGATVGAVVWMFLKAVSLGTVLIWDVIPDKAGISMMPVLLCTAGGILAGLVHKKYGEYPEELATVLGKIKKTKHYGYHPMIIMIVSALIPLIFGASVGPEAGLTGIIAGLCCWIGDNVKYAKEHADEYSDIGAAVTLGSLFHVPLFGIFAVEENEMTGGGSEDREKETTVMPKGTKILLYGIALAAAFLVIKGLGYITGSSLEGLPGFSYQGITAADYAMTLVYIPAGILLYVFFQASEKICEKVSGYLPVILREAVCGLGIGTAALTVPNMLFSGEEQMGLMQEKYAAFAAAALMGLCMLKLFMTAFCIKFGLKGGHFFPVIFACSCMGFGIAMAVFAEPAGHTVFAAAVITAAMLGAQMKKPVAVSMLLLICFPVRLVLWILLGAAAGGKIAAVFRIDTRERPAVEGK